MCSSWFFLCWLTGAQRQTSFQGTEFQHCCWLFYWETISVVRQALQLLDGGKKKKWDAGVLVKCTSLFSVMWMDSKSRHGGMCVLSMLTKTWISRADSLWQTFLWEHKWPSSECEPFLVLSTELQLRSAAAGRRKSKFAFQDLFVLLFSGLPYLICPKFELSFLQESWAPSPSPPVVFTAWHLEMVLTSFDKHTHLESQCGCSEKRRHFFFSFLFMNWRHNA